jgi:hypothetical protein
MTDIETQASQRTVVAFISGLLIGGLLVWVFSSSPSTPAEVPAEEETEATSEENTENQNAELGPEAAPANESSNEAAALRVSDQAAGDVVTVDSVSYNGTTGWIVVRDYANGVSGNVLGAARYDLDAGLMPKIVELARDTVAGNSYEVLFYTNDAERAFSLAGDMPVEGVRAVFTAQ